MLRGWCRMQKPTQSLAQLCVSGVSCLPLIRKRLTKGRIAWVDPSAKEACWAARLLHVDSRPHESVYDDEWWMWNPPAAIQPPSAVRGWCGRLPPGTAEPWLTVWASAGCTELTPSLNNWDQNTSNGRKSPSNFESETGGYIRHYLHDKVWHPEI